MVWSCVNNASHVQAPTGRRQPGECSNLLSRLLRLVDFCVITSFLLPRFPRTTRVAWPTWCWVATTESRYKNLFCQCLFVVCQYCDDHHGITTHDLMIPQQPPQYHCTWKNFCVMIPQQPPQYHPQQKFLHNDTATTAVVSPHLIFCCGQYHSGHHGITALVYKHILCVSHISFCVSTDHLG